MATITASITVPDALLPLIEHAAKQDGKTVPAYLSERLAQGQSVQSIANDRAQQAFWRLLQRNEIPAEIVAESAAVLPKESA